MTAYVAFTRKETLDKHKLATYAKEVPATPAGHEVKILAPYDSHEELESRSWVLKRTDEVGSAV